MHEVESRGVERNVPVHQTAEHLEPRRSGILLGDDGGTWGSEILNRSRPIVCQHGSMVNEMILR